MLYFSQSYSHMLTTDGHFEPNPSLRRKYYRSFWYTTIPSDLLLYFLAYYLHITNQFLSQVGMVYVWYCNLLITDSLQKLNIQLALFLCFISSTNFWTCFKCVVILKWGNPKVQKAFYSSHIVIHFGLTVDLNLSLSINLCIRCTFLHLFVHFSCWIDKGTGGGKSARGVETCYELSHNCKENLCMVCCSMFVDFVHWSWWQHLWTCTCTVRVLEFCLLILLNDRLYTTYM